ncbi:MAG: hypothetical protein KAW56_13645, partial [Candidatus Marinimicrobia bacterium]|nr:hypothetical protein [Candidatus Neomarinimicrobiota bacterium]
LSLATCNRIYDLSVNAKNYILESLKYILKKEGFYEYFVVLKNGYRKIKKDFIFDLYWRFNRVNIYSS